MADNNWLSTLRSPQWATPSAFLGFSPSTPFFNDQNPRRPHPPCRYLKMNPPMLPITNPSASSAMVATTSLTANAATMLIQEHHDETARLLIDGRAVDTKPFLPRASSYTSTGTPVNGSSFYQQRRRRIASDTSLASLTTDGGSRSEYVAHAASETYLLTRLGFKLLRYLGYGFSLSFRGIALFCFVYDCYSYIFKYLGFAENWVSWLRVDLVFGTS